MEIDRDMIVTAFLGESEELLGRMEELLVALERQPEDVETIQELLRGAHTLKGNAAMLGLSGVAELAHVVEDLLEGLRDGGVPFGTKLITRLLESVDALRELVSVEAAGPQAALRPAHAGLPRALKRALPRESAEPRGEPGRAAASATDASGRAARAPRADRTRTLRVGTDRLDRILNLTGEMTIARERLRQVLVDGKSMEDALEVHREADRIHLELQEEIMGLRMVPLGPVFRSHLRAVRDTAARHGKEASLTLEGEDVEVDTSVIEHLRDPLTHMVRNALDHGIEPPDVRVRSGKDPVGRITLRAFHEGGNIVVQVADDGAGIDRDGIIRRAQALGLIGDAGGLADAELYRLLFEPGFSTADAVTDLSGRGIGLDVVRRNIEQLRGTISIAGQAGRGTTLTIRLPLTLAIIEGFTVGVGEERYVIPLDAVVECLALPDGARSAGQGVLELRGKPLPYIRLRHLFDLGDHASARESVVIIQHGAGRVGLVVDALYGEGQAVIKPLGQPLGDLPGVSGCTILGNGRVALILDVPAVVERVVREERERTESQRPAMETGTAPGAAAAAPSPTQRTGGNER